MGNLGDVLVKSLTEKQKQLGDDSDRAFATRLGVTRSLWQKTRKGTIPMARMIALAVIDVFPDLRPTATTFLLTPRANTHTITEKGNGDGAAVNSITVHEITHA